MVRFVPLLMAVSLAGCTDLPESSTKEKPVPTVALGASFDPATAGSITGRVTWAGPTPTPEGFVYATPKPQGGFDLLSIANPHEPRVQAQSRGLANAVVFLRGIAPATSKPWDLPEASVELRDFSIGIRQAPGDLHRVGFVKRGNTLTMESREAAFHNLRARGAAFFSLAFPEADRPLSRTLDKNGLVHLSSGAGYYWASAYLFVDDLPYYTRTDSEGRFTLTGVPPGPVEVVAWHPNRKFSNQVRDPETSAVTRQTYGEPHQAAVQTTVVRGSAATVELTLGADGKPHQP